MTFEVKIGTFGDDNTAQITIGGREVGWLERVYGERFASASSRARVPFVEHYSVMLTDEAPDAQLGKHTVASRAEAKREVAWAFERALENVTASRRPR